MDEGSTYAYQVWDEKAKGNGFHMYVGAVRPSETSPNKFWRDQPKGK